MSTIDCFLLGFYDPPFAEYMKMMRGMGTRSGAYRDLALAFVELEGRPERALDVLTRLTSESQARLGRPFNNGDFLWPVITYLKTYLTRRGFMVDYANLPHFEIDTLKRKLRETRVRAVAITTTLYVSPHPILDLVSVVRQCSPETKIIVGGPYISNQVKAISRADLTALLRYLNADIYVLCSEGEATLAAVLSSLRANASLEFVSNLAFFSEPGRISYTTEAPESNHLAENMVEYSLFTDEEIGEFITTRTAKSCPFSCAFCGFPARAGNYTYLSVTEVEKEFNAIAARPSVTTVTLIDDTFNVPKARFKEILRMMIRNGYKFKWNCFYRADHGDAETIELMALAGCEGVFLGVESGSDAILSLMNKAARRHHYAEAIPLLNAAGISTYTSLIVGFPGETDDTVRETIDLIEESRPEFFRAQLWYADPLTPIWKDRELHGIVGEGFRWAHKTMDVDRACEWIDTMFLGINGSTWLPQFGFEQWSTFYLQRKGMSRGAIRRFLRSFNAIIKHRLVSYGAPPVRELIDELKLACQFSAHEGVASPVGARWTGAAYGEASEVLATELSGAGVFPPTRRDGAGLARVSMMEIDWSHANARDDGTGGFSSVLAAYAAAVAVETGNRMILASKEIDSALPVPLRFRSALDQVFSLWVDEACDKVRRVFPHAHYALAISENGAWRRRHQLTDLRCAHAVRFVERDEGIGPYWLSALGEGSPSELVTVMQRGGSAILSIQVADGVPVEDAENRLKSVARLLLASDTDDGRSVASVVSRSIHHGMGEDDFDL
jgi:radical SAM PhpK family P-methyltransferase